MACDDNKKIQIITRPPLRKMYKRQIRHHLMLRNLWKEQNLLETTAFEKGKKERSDRERDEEDNSEKGGWNHIIKVIEQLVKTCFTKRG